MLHIYLHTHKSIQSSPELVSCVCRKYRVAWHKSTICDLRGTGDTKNDDKLVGAGTRQHNLARVAARLQHILLFVQFFVRYINDTKITVL